MNHVFLSYRRESPEHERDVRRLGDLLRDAGIPVELEQWRQEREIVSNELAELEHLQQGTSVQS